jgi:hypothetical protein
VEQYGGGTVWPCLSKYGDNNETNLANSCTYAFNEGGRWFDGDLTVKNGIYEKHRANEKLNNKLSDILIAAHYGCLNTEDQPSWIKIPAVRTVAKKGAAVVFFHDKIDLSPDTNSWHTGCIQGTGEKWTLQKFKELPNIYRNRVAAETTPSKKEEL